MTCSAAQLEANRQNAQKSTGPKTPEGKAKSRANALKHGLTGAGVVMASDDLDEINRRFEKLEEEMVPNGEMGRYLLKRLAVLTVKLDRGTEHECRAIAYRKRRARKDFDDARLAEAEKLLSWIAHEPATNARRLRNSPEGIDLLVAELRKLCDDLGHKDYAHWDWQHCERFHHLIGKRPLDVPLTRAKALSDAVDGNFKLLNSDDAPDLEKVERQCWAATTLLELIEAEIEALQTLKASFDLEGLERDREEAAARAIFDPSKEAVLARKYEAANERSMFRSLKEFRQIQQEVPPPRPDPAEPETEDESGSFFAVPEEEDEDCEIVESSVPIERSEVEIGGLERSEPGSGAQMIDDR